MVVKGMRDMRQAAKSVSSPLRSAAEFVSLNLRNDLLCAEVGVFKGENAEMMLKHMTIKKLYLIDQYVFDDNYKLSYTDDMVPIKTEALDRLSKFEEKIEWIFKDSLNAATFIPDELDFIYIDANHTYPYVKADIENFWPKVKKGGVLGGHDYCKLSGKVGVKTAVNEFAKNNNLKLHIGGTDWWIVKN